MKQKVLAFFAVFLTVLMITCKREAVNNSEEPGYSDASSIIVTESMVSALNKITGEYQKRGDIITFVKSVLPNKGMAFYEEFANEYHGVKYLYDENGKYFFVYEIEYGGSGSSYERMNTYIFDTDLLELITIEDIFINASDPSFVKLINEYLSKDDSFDRIDKEFLENPTPGELFYSKNGVGMKWGRGTISANALSFEIVLPYTIVQGYLTPTGKDVFKGEN